jgi:hypothetical protein
MKQEVERERPRGRAGVNGEDGSGRKPCLNYSIAD